jgi:Protein of unknown function (DUF3325)
MKALLLLAAYLSCVLGWSCLALAMETHWQQVRADTSALGQGTVRLLRGLGAAGLLGSLLLCLRADHASMASLVWVLTLTVAALSVAFTLTWRPRLLAPLVLWIRPSA